MTRHPSDILSELSDILSSLEQTSAVPSVTLELWLDEGTEHLLAHVTNDEPWKLDGDRIEEELHALGLDRPPTLPTTSAEFVRLLQGVQLLDAWHFPLTAAGAASGVPKVALHEEALDRLTYDGYFGRSAFGRIIPATALHTPRFNAAIAQRHWNTLRSKHSLDAVTPSPQGATHPQIIRSVLENVVHLPWTVSAADADDSSTFNGRSVITRYVALRPLIPATGDNHIVTIIPLLQDYDDADISVSSDNSNYTVRPKAPDERIYKCLYEAIFSESTFIFMPETVINESSLDDLRRHLRDIAKEYDDAKGRLPPMVCIFCGVAGERSNYIVCMDMSGKEYCRQPKLFRWNLTDSQVVRFGILERSPELKTPLRENIDEGGEIYVFDIIGYGRFLIFICADISSNTPGDWMLANARLDWLYAPILDQSISWEFDSRGFLGPWISRRAHRAALASSGRVIVANSMSLTHHVNKSNANRGDPRQFGTAGVALLIDATSDEVKYVHKSFSVSQVGDLIQSSIWLEDWDKLII